MGKDITKDFFSVTTTLFDSIYVLVYYHGFFLIYVKSDILRKKHSHIIYI